MLPFLWSALLPCGRAVPPSGEVWDACAARGCAFDFCCPAGAGFRPTAKFGRLRGVRFLLGWTMLIFFAALRALGFALRRSWDACAACGKVGPVMGLRPLRGPPCIPPEAPPRAFSNSAKRRGHAARAAGASFPRSTRSGDLPPRRVNARFHFRSGWNPFHPTTIGLAARFGNSSVLFSRSLWVFSHHNYRDNHDIKKICSISASYIQQ